MRRTVKPTAPRLLTRIATEVYCRRENRVVATCPNAERAAGCPCLHGVETADALFEPSTSETEAAS